MADGVANAWSGDIMLVMEKKTLRQLRRETGIPMEVLAVRAGVSSSTIARTETGKSDPLAAVRAAIAAALGVSPEEIDWEAPKREKEGE